MIKLKINNRLINVEFFAFPDGTRHVKIKENILAVEAKCAVEIVAQVSSSDDIIDILLLKDAVDRQTAYQFISLTIPYMLGSRQDRIMVEGEPLSVQVYANMLNLANFDEISILDPHSSATLASLNNGNEMRLEGYYEELDININTENMVVVSPDAGAVKRATTFAKVRCIKTLIKSDKTRDLATGKITDFELYASEEDIIDKDVYIVDDIVTNGGTFLGLKEEIDKYYPKSVSLVVTHADHGEGLVKMSNSFDNVYVTNSKNNYLNLDWTVYNNLTVTDIFSGAMN